MSRKMLIDATHPEEIRVVVVDGGRLEEFDYENIRKKQLKGNIYLGKVVRVEPSLQAAFVDFGSERHGFLPFNEIHPDYYKIPVADQKSTTDAPPQDMIINGIKITSGEDPSVLVEAVDLGEQEEITEKVVNEKVKKSSKKSKNEVDIEVAPVTAIVSDILLEPTSKNIESTEDQDTPTSFTVALTEDHESLTPLDDDVLDEEEVEAVVQHRHRYRIQEVIKRGQVILVQVVKEERGNKGAALTSYLSLPGRYCVLMPNSGMKRGGGGVSRRIEDQQDRLRLREVVKELDVPEEMGLIIRTAGQERSKLEIRKDYEYLTKLWNEIRQMTLQSIAPKLIYAEGDLIKRAIRDIYTRDMEKVIVDGEEGYKSAKALMKKILPSHARKVQLYKDERIPLFHAYQVETQIGGMLDPICVLPSGGYIVINATEALISIDVNSGKATKERHIEDTALKTNLEAADEAARQICLRDLGGLLVIDFIDMHDQRHVQAVEKRFKDAIKNDRARIQIGKMSQFGLLEISRQRLKPSLLEAHTSPCAHCKGVGFIRSVESSSLHILRMIEVEGLQKKYKEISISVPVGVDSYLLNQKRQALAKMEERFNMTIHIYSDTHLVAPEYRIHHMVYWPSTNNRSQENRVVETKAIESKNKTQPVEEKQNHKNKTQHSKPQQNQQEKNNKDSSRHQKNGHKHRKHDVIKEPLEETIAEQEVNESMEDLGLNEVTQVSEGQDNQKRQNRNNRRRSHLRRHRNFRNDRKDAYQRVDKPEGEGQQTISEPVEPAVESAPVAVQEQNEASIIPLKRNERKRNRYRKPNESVSLQSDENVVDHIPAPKKDTQEEALTNMKEQPSSEEKKEAQDTNNGEKKRVRKPAIKLNLSEPEIVIPTASPEPEQNEDEAQQNKKKIKHKTWWQKLIDNKDKKYY